MAGRVNLKVFYGALGLIAVLGALAIWLAASRSAGSGTQILETPVPVGTAGSPGYVMGSDTAPVEVVEYADFMCGACGAFSILSEPDIRQRLVAPGRIRFRFRGFPLHQESLLPHHAAECAGEQERFWEMHDQLMQNQSRWATDSRPLGKFREYAEAIGLDMGAYQTCMDEGRYAALLLATRDELTALNINSTPTFDIGRYRVVGAIPYDSVRTLVDLATEAARGPGG
jgi:protein-disulfide isomerase